ncbi:uncharacterized protein C4orf54 homolog [Alosa pseudoharengus]|uniref:uncharacterized protein C4orf54 homolog n=1 Tax=Alosa pseudoharengus TaxID=34774 RepID=UPI003F8916A8
MEKKSESKATNQAALEKLKAAVKTMEQLYVFDRNEWKRKTQAPRPVTDSHVLSLITSEEQGGPSKTESEDDLGKGTEIERPGVSTNKAIAPKFPKTPLSLKITPPKREAEEKGPAKSSETFLQAQPIKPAPAETENYLTIPVRACTTDTPASSAAITSSHLGASSHSQQQALQRSPIIMESWAPDSPTSTTIYHHSLPIPLTATGPQVLCISPSLVPSVAEPMQQQQTQKKMLLDPTTGHYYLVDTPVQPATKRLYDPETGQYVDVPVPPPQPLTPVPMPMSPLALSPGTAFAPTYMIYPSLMASPTAFTTHSLSSSTQSEGDGERAQGKDSGPRAGVGVGSPSGTHPPDHSRGVGGISVGPGGKPVISITTQQGPRIIAPPSFDGTTMSFVVEHR